MSASRTLFCVTTSSGCCATRNLNRRGPASVAVARTRAVAGLPSAGQLHLLRADDPPLVFDVDRHRPPRVAGLRDDDVDHQRGVLQHALRRADAIDLDVARQLRAADADGEDRQLLRLQAEQGVAERHVARVGAVGHEHDAGHRQPGQFLARAVERRRRAASASR